MSSGQVVRDLVTQVSTEEPLSESSDDPGKEPEAKSVQVFNPVDKTQTA